MHTRVTLYGNSLCYIKAKPVTLGLPFVGIRTGFQSQQMFALLVIPVALIADGAAMRG